METAVLGLGNQVRADDSIGIRIVRELERLFGGQGISVMTSTSGLDVLVLFEGYERAIIIDAVQTEGGKAGQVYRIEPGQLDTARATGTAHTMDIVAALELGNKLGLNLPGSVVIFGVEVQDTESITESCTPEVERAIPACISLVLEELSRNSSPHDPVRSASVASPGKQQLPGDV